MNNIIYNIEIKLHTINLILYFNYSCARVIIFLPVISFKKNSFYNIKNHKIVYLHKIYIYYLKNKIQKTLKMSI